MFRMSHDSVDFFSADFTVAGVIVADYSWEYSHWAAKKSLSEWLKVSLVMNAIHTSVRMTHS